MGHRLQRIRLISAAVMMLCIGHAASAQDVDGIALWDKCTKEQLIEKYDKAIKYFSQEEDEPELGLIEEIEFKDVFFRLEGNRVVAFGFDSTKPRAMTKFISGGIKIGDSEETVTKKLETYELYRRTVLEDGEVEYDYYVDKDNRFHIFTKGGKIVYISAEATTT